MKKIEIKVSAIIAATLSGIISILGFSGCKTQKNVKSEGESPVGINRPIMVMYGVPSSVYKVQGTITGPDGKPVSDATVEISDSSGEVLEEVKPNPDGTYFTQYMRVPGDLKVVARPNNDAGLEADSTVVKTKNLLNDRRSEVNFKLKKRK